MYIKVHVQAGVKEEKFEKVAPDSFEVAVRQKAERGMANDRVLELVREHFGRSVGAIRIISGHHSPTKIISVG
ncbi:MAG: hypothetical protein A3D56_00025 [Candidatus Taylorbacteria bacterium RIFCSPHIGHO2_02_FULL_45_35]|uniref:Uncharacterized protein n=1 Tax=Candidatus Taylorbacteria bacterium RIFCSPHIGHO2_02_FULL_45_35 TaxID=1802311 RepID=A0A1G2MYF9_9BACT|nr:MAG: hypothetical protein A3D56_00025 [Candidatus Taylorbacteria bacterium RIFCSPHIGHO2_02_FULL_45_35]OHA34877.1 MAG: hypothetical protein A3A22_02820 [Candidatus Taylorbacteria bacterium RIFCSPLOWO2_01_FULL_45_34b]